MEEIHCFLLMLVFSPMPFPPRQAPEHLKKFNFTIFCVKGKQEIQMFENYFCLTLIQKGQLHLPQPLQQAAVLSQHVPLCIFTLAFPFHLTQVSVYLDRTCESSRSCFAVIIFKKNFHRKAGCIIPQPACYTMLSFTELTQNQLVLLGLCCFFPSFFWRLFSNEIIKCFSFTF